MIWAFELGKTVQVIGVINYIIEIKSVLIICPNNVKINWRNELERFKTRNLSVGIATPKEFPETDIVITNYDLLKKYHNQLRAKTWDAIVVDESHFIKNPKAIRTIQIIGKKNKNVWVIPPINSPIRIALSGTPFLNRPIELYPVLHWLDPKVYDNFFKFGIRYANGHKGQWGWDFSGYSNLTELQQKLRSTVMIRRKKSEVLTDLPPKIRQVIEMPLPDNDGNLALFLKEREVYEQCMEELYKLKEAVELAKISDNQEDYHNALSKLRESQSIAFNKMAKARHDTAVLKMPILADHIKEVLEGNEGKIVVFAHHHDAINILANEFKGMCSILTGEHDIEEKDEAVTKFVTDPDCRLFIGSIHAAGIGLNRLQLASSHAIFAELDWTPAWITQCEDRLHRIGQKDSVLVQHYVLEGSIDALIAKKIVSKQNISDKALDKGLEVGNTLTLEELAPNNYNEKSPELVTPDQITIDANKLNSKQINDIHKALQIISGMCDGAKSLDGHGFNKFDVRLGKNLAEQSRLTPKAAALGRKIVLKYRKQLEDYVIESFKEIE
jgi:SWI/SNF-related matrix-associated actin-dependent regulator 1 of chromatin subfamily A